jgi:branched chain amino acid efflux pump
MGITTVGMPQTGARDHAATRTDVRAGVAAMVPFLFGLAPFALVIGATAAERGAPFGGWTGSWLVYGGSAHLGALRALDSGVAVAVATGVLVNARLVVYSASLAQRWRDQPAWFRAVAAAMVVEPTWAAAERHAAQGPSPRGERGFFLAAGISLGVGWSALIALGALAGTTFDRPELGAAVPLCLAAMIGPMLARRDNRVPMVVGALVALLADGLPAGTGLLAAIAAACLAGLAFDSSEGASR